jgi:hypothetical protein
MSSSEPSPFESSNKLRFNYPKLSNMTIVTITTVIGDENLNVTHTAIVCKKR